MKFEEALKFLTQDQRFDDLNTRFFLLEKAASHYRDETGNLHPTFAILDEFKIKLLLDITQQLYDEFNQFDANQKLENLGDDFVYNNFILDDLSKEKIFLEVDKSHLNLLYKDYVFIFDHKKEIILNSVSEYEKTISKLTNTEMKFNKVPNKDDINNFFSNESHIFKNLKFEQQNVTKLNIEATWINHVNAFASIFVRCKEFHQKMLDGVQYAERKSEQAKTSFNFKLTAITAVLGAITGVLGALFAGMAVPQLGTIFHNDKDSTKPSKSHVIIENSSEVSGSSEKLNQSIEKIKKSEPPIPQNSKN